MSGRQYRRRRRPALVEVGRDRVRLPPMPPRKLKLPGGVRDTGCRCVLLARGKSTASWTPCDPFEPASAGFVTERTGAYSVGELNTGQPRISSTTPSVTCRATVPGTCVRVPGADGADGVVAAPARCGQAGVSVGATGTTAVGHTTSPSSAPSTRRPTCKRDTR